MRRGGPAAPRHLRQVLDFFCGGPDAAPLLEQIAWELIDSGWPGDRIIVQVDAPPWQGAAPRLEGSDDLRMALTDPALPAERRIAVVEELMGNKALRVSTATVYALVERGQLEHVRVSNVIRVTAEALERYLKPVAAPTAAQKEKCHE